MRKKRFFYIIFAVLFVLYFASRFLIGSFITVSGVSMHPTFKNGEVVFCTRIHDNTIIEKGDIVIFKHDGNYLIKRVAGTEGDKVLGKYDFDGVLCEKVENNHYFLLGDNYECSKDSRVFGTVEREQIKYKYAGFKISSLVWYTGIIIVVSAIAVTAALFGENEEKSKKKGDISNGI